MITVSTEVLVEHRTWVMVPNNRTVTVLPRIRMEYHSPDAIVNQSLPLCKFDLVLDVRIDLPVAKNLFIILFGTHSLLSRSISSCTKMADHNGHQFCVNGGHCKADS